MLLELIALRVQAAAGSSCAWSWGSLGWRAATPAMPGTALVCASGCALRLLSEPVPPALVHGERSEEHRAGATMQAILLYAVMILGYAGVL